MLLLVHICVKSFSLDQADIMLYQVIRPDHRCTRSDAARRVTGLLQLAQSVKFFCISDIDAVPHYSQRRVLAFIWYSCQSPGKGHREIDTRELHSSVAYRYTPIFITNNMGHVSGKSSPKEQLLHEFSRHGSTRADRRPVVWILPNTRY